MWVSSSSFFFREGLGAGACSCSTAAALVGTSRRRLGDPYWTAGQEHQPGGCDFQVCSTFGHARQALHGGLRAAMLSWRILSRGIGRLKLAVGAAFRVMSLRNLLETH
jgi:hypothetical protein